MKNRLNFLCLTFLCVSCLEDKPLPPCQLSQTGWVCADTGTTDTSKQEDLATDTPGVKDMGTKDLSSDTIEDTKPSDMTTEDMTPSPAKTCGEINDRNLPTGNHDIEVDGQMVKVHCNNDVANGGWMLLARSVAGGAGAFGWMQSAGSVEDDAVPFSLGSTSIAFTEVLATNYTNGKTPGDRQYIVSLPNNFLTDCADTSCETTVTSPTNSCAPNLAGNEVFMFDYVGYLSNDFFWFREIVEDANTGFRPDGWNIFFDDCRAGEIHTQQGLLFVR